MKKSKKLSIIILSCVILIATATTLIILKLRPTIKYNNIVKEYKSYFVHNSDKNIKDADIAFYIEDVGFVDKKGNKLRMIDNKYYDIDINLKYINTYNYSDSIIYLIYDNMYILNNKVYKFNGNFVSKTSDFKYTTPYDSIEKNGNIVDNDLLTHTPIYPSMFKYVFKNSNGSVKSKYDIVDMANEQCYYFSYSYNRDPYRYLSDVRLDWIYKGFDANDYYNKSLKIHSVIENEKISYFIDNYGNKIEQLKYKDIYPYKYGKAYVKDTDNQSYFIDENYNRIDPPKYKSYVFDAALSEDIYIGYIGDGKLTRTNMVVVDESGKLIKELNNTQYISDFYNGKAIISDNTNKNAFIINKQGDTTTDVLKDVFKKYPFVIDISLGYTTLSDDSHKELESATSFNNGYACVPVKIKLSKGNKYYKDFKDCKIQDGYIYQYAVIDTNGKLCFISKNPVEFSCKPNEQ